MVLPGKAGVAAPAATGGRAPLDELNQWNPVKYAGLILKGLTRNRRRTALTVMSIAVSFFLFSTLISLPSVAQRLMPTGGASVRVVCRNKAGFGHGLPEAYTSRIRALPHVDAVSAWNFFGSRYRRPGDTFPTIDLDVDDLETIWPEWGIAPDELAKFKRIRTACLIGPELIRRYGWRVGDQVSLLGLEEMIPVTLRIVGTLGPQAPPNYLIFHRDYLKEVYKHWPHRVKPEYDVDFYWIKVDSPKSIPSVIAEVDNGFANSDYETVTESESGFITGLLSFLASLFLVAKLLGVVVLFTMTLVAANTAAMSARERRVEIAVLRAIGFGRGIVLGTILGESLILGVAGGAIGCISGYVALRALDVGAQILDLFGGSLRMPLGVIGESLAAAAVLGLLSGGIPALLAVRRNIVESLRFVN